MFRQIFDIDNWREILSTLARNKTRTFLTAFGIFWGTAMLAMLWGGASGLRGMMSRNFQGFATNMGFLFSSRTTMSYKGYNKGLAWELNDADIAAIRELAADRIEASSCVGGHSGVLSYGSKSTATTISGVEDGYTDILTPIIYEGRFINAADIVGCRKVAVLGKNKATDIFGTESPIGKYVSVSGAFFYVVGVAGQMSEATINSKIDDSVIIPFTTMRRAYNLGDEVGSFIFTTCSGISPTDLKPTIERAIRAHHPIHPDDHFAYWLGDVTKEFRMVENLFIGISLLALFVGVGTLLAGIIGVGNIMWIIVKERTQEIGIRRAIGAKPKDIIIQILSEGTILTIIAGVAGLTFATIVLAVADAVTYDPLLGSAHFEILFSHAVAIMIAFVVLGVSAGLIPALRAMKIKPVEAINSK